MLQNAASEPFAAIRVPGGPGRYGPGDKLVFDRSFTVEGRISAFVYVGPKERSALEVLRYYQTALSQAGFASVYSCELRACDQALIREPFVAEALRARKWAGGRAGGVTPRMRSRVTFASLARRPRATAPMST